MTDDEKIAAFLAARGATVVKPGFAYGVGPYDAERMKDALTAHHGRRPSHHRHRAKGRTTYNAENEASYLEARHRENES